MYLISRNSVEVKNGVLKMFFMLLFLIVHNKFINLGLSFKKKRKKKYQKIENP